MISVRGLEFGYDDVQILRGIDLDVRKGETVALVGPSGSGKTTLLYCLAGVLSGWSGSIEVGGRSLQGMSERDLADLRAQHCGYILQFGRLIPELTARENVALPLGLLGVPRKEAQRHAEAMLERVGLAHRSRAVSSRLSGGEQQRTAIARALIHRPAVVFADEPTGALDTANSDLVLKMLVDQARSNGSAVVIVTHERDVAARADRVVEMRDGALIAQGDPYVR